MHIVFDARLYGIKHRGIGRYVQELVQGLATTAKASDTFTLLVDPTNQELVGKLPKNFNTVAAPWRVYSLAEQVQLPRLIKKLQPDLVHVPHFNAPLFCSAPVVVTVHDLILHHFPDRRASRLPRVMYWLKLVMYRLLVRLLLVHKARAIIAVSACTAKDIARYYPAVVYKLHTILLGESFAATQIKTQTDVDTPDLYVLTVGSAYPHKNLHRAAHVVARAAQIYPNLKYVVVGKQDAFMTEFAYYLERFGLKQTTLVWGEATDAELVSLYRGACVYFAPSLIEGVGLGALDAMSLGTPVLASDIPAFREVLGDAAKFFDPYSVSDMSSALVSLIADANMRNQLVLRGRERSNAFDWKQTVAATYGVYCETLRQ